MSGISVRVKYTGIFNISLQFGERPTESPATANATHSREQRRTAKVFKNLQPILLHSTATFENIRTMHLAINLDRKRLDMTP